PLGQTRGRRHVGLDPHGGGGSRVAFRGARRASAGTAGEPAVPGRLPPGLAVRSGAAGRPARGGLARRKPGCGVRPPAEVAGAVGAFGGVPPDLVGAFRRGSGPAAERIARAGDGAVSAAGVRVGVGTRFRYDGETVEAVQLVSTAAGGEVVLAAGRGRLLRMSVKELLFSDRARVIADGPGPGSADD